MRSTAQALDRDEFRLRHKLLIVDEDAEARARVSTRHQCNGWEVLQATGAVDALRALHAHRPNVILLAVEMAGLDGFGALQRIREISDVPVIMTSKVADDAATIRGLRAGADDFVSTPYTVDEILARTEAQVRRAPATPEFAALEYDDGVITINARTVQVTVYREELQLTPLEYRLLVAFARHPRQVLAHTQLLELAWSSPIGTRDQVKVTVSALRRKIEPAGDQIRTARGFGYKFVPAR